MRFDAWRSWLLVFGGVVVGAVASAVLFARSGNRPVSDTLSPTVSTSPPQTSTGIPPQKTPPSVSGSSATAPTTSLLSFVYSFNAPGALEEAPSASRSTSPYWFLDSGGELIVGNSEGSTMQGAAETGSAWQSAYARSSATDTDDGRYPQNLFRLVTKEDFSSPRMQASFLIERDNLTNSPNRNESNGLLLMSRYQNGNTLYYAGIRVDGTAVIKKKYNGVYYTMSQVPLFTGTYDRTHNPNLLPHATWLTLRMDTRTLASGSVEIRLSLSQDGGATWETVAAATDDGSYGGTPPLTLPGLCGIRTDFMDVGFKNIRISELTS